jgi:hypothetical protein
MTKGDRDNGGHNAEDNLDDESGRFMVEGMMWKMIWRMTLDAG